MSTDVTKATAVTSDDSQKDNETGVQIKQNESSSESFVKSALNRQGSVNYRNAAWKPTPPVRQSSMLSTKSNSSGNFSHPASPGPGSPITKSPIDQQAYLQSQFREIFNILKNCSVDEDIMVKIKG